MEKSKSEQNLENDKPSRKVGGILRELDEKELEQVNGGACLTCGLLQVPFPIPGPLPRPPEDRAIVIGS